MDKITWPTEGVLFGLLASSDWTDSWIIVKLDIHTDYARRGCFTRLAVCVDLRKPLVSKVRINGRLQRVEYEALPNICFRCGLYGLAKEACLSDEMISSGVELEAIVPTIEKSGLDL